MFRLNAIDWTALILAIVGAINWGLVGLFGFNLVNAIFGWSPRWCARHPSSQNGRSKNTLSTVT